MDPNHVYYFIVIDILLQTEVIRFHLKKDFWKRHRPTKVTASSKDGDFSSLKYFADLLKIRLPKWTCNFYFTWLFSPKSSLLERVTQICRYVNTYLHGLIHCCKHISKFLNLIYVDLMRYNCGFMKALARVCTVFVVISCTQQCKLSTKKDILEKVFVKSKLRLLQTLKKYTTFIYQSKYILLQKL